MQSDVSQAGPESKAFVRYSPQDSTLSVTLTYNGKQRNLNRTTTEPLEKALGRLRASVQPAVKGGKRQKNAPPPPPPVDLGIALFKDEQASVRVDESTPCGSAWSSARRLRIGDQLFDVVVNPPTVDKIVVLRRAIVGFPLLPVWTLAFADESLSSVRWSRALPGSSSWEDAGCSDALYTPREQDVGYRLRVECTPARAVPAGRTSDVDSGTGRRDVSSTGGDAQREAGGAAPHGGGGDPAASRKRSHEAIVSETGPPSSAETDVVEAAPTQTSASVRCGGAASLAAPAPGAWRILSYNILADQYAASDYAKDVLFNYCPKAQLDPDYRKQLVLLEVLAYGADVVCLQEVDERNFTEYLVPHLRRAGYEGHYTNKMGGRVKEGSAMFWKTAHFQLVAAHDILLRDVFQEPLAPQHVRFAPLLAASRDLTLALQHVTTIAQAVLLAPTDACASAAGVPSSPLLVCNTHLFFHPYAPHIRTIHVAAILEEASAIAERYQTTAQQQQQAAGAGAPADTDDKSSPAAPAVLFVGDLNSDLNDGVPGVVELLQSGRLAADYWDWQQGAAFRWGMGEEEGARPTPPVEAAAPTNEDPPGSQTPAGSMTTAGATATASADATAAPPAATSGSATAGAAPDTATAAATASDRATVSNPPSVVSAADAAMADATTGADNTGSSPVRTAHPSASSAQPILPQDQAALVSSVSSQATAPPQELKALRGASSSSADRPADAPASAAHPGFDGTEEDLAVLRPGVAVTGVDLQVPYRLRSADDLKTPYTNYTSGYKALLDYVWYEPDRLEVVAQPSPVPPEEMLASFIPSPVFPSDHLAVVYDFKWR